MLVAIPSKGRAGKVKSQVVVPEAVVYVPDYEAESYRQAGCKNVVAIPGEIKGITKTRNWILDNTKERHIVFIDDDVKQAGYVKLFKYNAKQRRLTGEQILTEWQKLFSIIEDMGFRIWGTATEGSLRSVYTYKPFLFRGYITASCMGMINTKDLRFDESFPVKEDYEICLRCHKEDGGVLCARHFFWENSHWKDEGGCKDYRTRQMEKDCIERLKKLYPGQVVDAPNKQSEYCIKLIL